MKREPIFETEAALCAAFIEWAKGCGYTCYPETEGWDILLVDSSGFQIGVEAKLRLNITVILQALPQYSPDIGPDHRAVLVPERGPLAAVLPYLGIECFYTTARYSARATRHYFTHDDSFGATYGRPMFDWNPVKRHKLPQYIPDVPAGVPAPVQLTPWKIGALRVLAHIELFGPLTRKQVNTYGIDSRAWCGHGAWLIPVDGSASTRNGRWARGPKCPAFDKQHPDVYAQVLADMQDSPPPQQKVMEVA